MKKTILFSLLSIFLAFNINAQNDWPKNERQNVMDEGVALLAKNTDIPKDKKMLIAKCYMDFITATYTLQKYKSLIDYELETVQKSTINKCAKDNGFDLDEPKVEVKKVETKKADSTGLKPTKENLVGHWKTDEDDEFWLSEPDMYKMKYSNGKTAKGTWKIEGDELTLNKENLLGKSEKVYKILYFSKDTFFYKSLKNKSKSIATRIK